MYFIIAIALALVADIPQGFGGVYTASKAFFYALLLFSLLLPIRTSLLFLLMISIVCQDVTQAQSEVMEQGLTLKASVWQGGIGFLRPGWFMIAYCLALLVKGRIYVGDQPVVYAALWFLTVPLVTALAYGSFGTDVAQIEVPIDVKLPMFLLVSIVLYRSYLRGRPDELGVFAAAFVGAILARHFVDLGYWLIGIGAQFADVNRVSVDSTKGTVAFMLLFAMVLTVRQRRFFVGSVLGIASAVLIVVYTTRGLWVSSVLGVFIVLLLMRARRSALALIVMAILAYGSVQTMMLVQPENVELALKRLDRFSPAETGSLLENLDPSRYAELLNAFDATAERWAFLWGSGYGSYYTESVVPFPSNLQDAFPEYSLRDGRYYTLHHYVLRMLFEHGVIGFVLISGLWLIPGWHCFKMLRDSRPDLFLSFMMALIAFIPTSMLEMSWTGKGMIIAGFTIALCMCSCEHERHSRNERRASHLLDPVSGTDDCRRDMHKAPAEAEAAP